MSNYNLSYDFNATGIKSAIKWGVAFLSLALFATIIGVSSLLIYHEEDKYLMILVSTASMIIAAGITIFTNFKKNKDASSNDVLSVERTTQSQINSLHRDLEKKIDKLNEKIENPDELINKELAKKIDENMISYAAENIIAKAGEVTNSFAKDYSKNKATKQLIEDAFNIPIKQVQDYAVSAQKASAAFRFLGILLALIGLSIASWVFYKIAMINILSDGNPNKIEWQDILPFSLPLILSCEFLAFIMFSFSNKYFENMRSFYTEQTTLSIKSGSIRAVIEYADSNIVSKVLANTTETERNYILKKDEQTLEMANNKHSLEHLKAIHGMLPNIKDVKEVMPKTKLKDTD